MYGVVLLLAVTASSESADLGRRGGCRGCHGCHGCYGGCHGYHGCHGCYGGCHGYHGCHGCYGGHSCGGYAASYGCGGYAPSYGCGGYAASYGCYGSVVVPGHHHGHHHGKTVAYEAPANAATVVVTLPADAKLTIDGEATTSTSAERSFQTPELTPGKVYSYTLAASYQKDGKTVNVSKKVKVEAGKVSTIDLMDAAPATGVARN